MDIQWPLVLFTVFAGCGAGLLAYGCLGEFLGVSPSTRAKSAFISCILMVVGGCFSVLHLAQPANIMAAAQHIGSLSGVSVEMICLGASAVLAFVYFLMTRKAESSTTASKVVAVLCILAGLFFCFALGNGYVISAREAWNTLALPFAYLGTNLSMGAFAFAVVCACFKERSLSNAMKALVAVGSLLGVVLCAVYAIVEAGFLVQQAAAPLVVTIVFCLATAALGLAFWKKAGEKTFVAYASAGCACAVIGALGLRILMWCAGVAALDAFGYATSVIVL